MICSNKGLTGMMSSGAVLGSESVCVYVCVCVCVCAPLSTKVTQTMFQTLSCVQKAILLVLCEIFFRHHKNFLAVLYNVNLKEKMLSYLISVFRYKCNQDFAGVLP